MFFIEKKYRKALFFKIILYEKYFKLSEQKLQHFICTLTIHYNTFLFKVAYTLQTQRINSLYTQCEQKNIYTKYLFSASSTPKSRGWRSHVSPRIEPATDDVLMLVLGRGRLGWIEK